MKKQKNSNIFNSFYRLIFADLYTPENWSEKKNSIPFNI